jgi:fatty-acyl-CoA synthase
MLFANETPAPQPAMPSSEIQPDAPPPTRPASLAWVEALAATAEIEKHPGRLLFDLIEREAQAAPDAPALLSDGETFTFRELLRRAEGYRRWGLSQELQPGECVALMMANRPDYVAIWLGLSKAGIVTALINTSLAGSALGHCLDRARPRHIVAGQPFLPVVRAAMAEPGGTMLWSHDDLRQAADIAPPATGRSVTIDDVALLIFTSGTTGLPKAARVSHRRVLNWALWFKGLLGNTPADRMYDCLPLYHSVGGIVAVAATLVAGGSTVIAPKFSASRFWSDIRRWNCTQFQYIGELCRYLLNGGPSPDDRRHALRVVCGNGLREDVWMPFKERFAIPQIVEFYAATEGSFSLFNVEGRPGAIGRVPPFLRHRFPTAIVRYDHETAAPVRDADGFCIRAAAGEAGEAIGRIGAGEEGAGRFEGYTDAAETERKILRNVFRSGDAWFRTGDLMRTDRAGFYYFVDRLGDTFRWKGENVSTLEVANALSAAPGVEDVTVYGVAVPGADGKAGMALLRVREGFSLAGFWRHATARLPPYAVPLFVRIGRDLALTETFKPRKQDLVRDGFDPSATADQIHVRLGKGGYVPLDADRYARLCAGLEPL